MFARSIRLESQFHILMEILTEGVIGVNERGEIFTCSQRARDIIRTAASLVPGRRREQAFPCIGFDQCLRERRRLETWVEKLHGTNISVEARPCPAGRRVWEPSPCWSWPTGASSFWMKWRE